MDNNEINPIPVNQQAGATVLNRAYKLANQNNVALGNQYNGNCAKGTRMGVAALFNNTDSQGRAIASSDIYKGNAWATNNVFEQTGFYKPAEYTSQKQLTPDYFNTLPVGSVVSFNYGDYGHKMVRNIDGSWMSDKVVNESPTSNWILAKGDIPIAISVPNAAGNKAMQAANPGIQISSATGIENGISVPGGSASPGPNFYTSPQINSDSTAIGGSGTVNIVGNAVDITTTPDELITLNDNFFNGLSPEASAAVEPLAILQARANQPYSNRQFVSSVSLKINVEGIYKDIDFLQKQLSTSFYNPYKRNAALAINSNQVIRKGLNINNGKDRTARELTLKYGSNNSGVNEDISPLTKAINTQHSTTQTVYNAANNAITQNLATRIPTTPAAIAAAGNAVVTASKLNIPNTLPSTSSGNLKAILTAASSIASSGIPTSVTGAIALEQQIKTIICNFPIFIPPDISFKSLFQINGPALVEQIKKEIKNELDKIKDAILDPIKAIYNQIKDFFKPEHIKEMLVDLLPDPGALSQAAIDEFTKCNNGPAAKKNDLSGKSDKSSPAAAGAPPTLPVDIAASIVTNVQGFTPNTTFNQATAPNTFGTGLPTYTPQFDQQTGTLPGAAVVPRQSISTK
jgi:hypothetical protein